jgi:hypothetical protein
MNAKISTETLADIITEIIAESNKTASATPNFVDISLNTDNLDVLQINFKPPLSSS